MTTHTAENDALVAYDYGDHDPDAHADLTAFTDCAVCMARPVLACGYVGIDGCCEHDDNPTPECHIGIRCPLLTRVIPPGKGTR